MIKYWHSRHYERSANDTWANEKQACSPQSRVTNIPRIFLQTLVIYILPPLSSKQYHQNTKTHLSISEDIHIHWLVSRSHGCDSDKHPEHVVLCNSHIDQPYEQQIVDQKFGDWWENHKNYFCECVHPLSQIHASLPQRIVAIAHLSLLQDRLR